MLRYIDDFLLNLQANKYSPETVYSYERDLTIFTTFLQESSVKFENLSKRDIIYYKAYLASRDRKTANLSPHGGKELNPRSINHILSALRSYLRYLIEMDLPCPLPPEAVKLAKAGHSHPQVAELNQLHQLIESPTHMESKPSIALRNRAILEVLFATGMRISELCNLNRSQIDESGRIFITGKGRKQRFVYLTPRARQHLNAYLATRHDNCPALFIPYAGRNVLKRGRRISTNYVQERIKRYREKLKINVPTSAHSLRHGFATYLAERGANPAALQILLGHESLNTTTRYVHTSDKYAEETHHKFHPLAQPEDV